MERSIPPAALDTYALQIAPVDIIPLDHPRTATAEGDYEPVGGTMHAHSFVYPQLELPTFSHYPGYFHLPRSEDGT